MFDNTPLFSIVIPARNEEAMLPECLAAIKKQEGGFAMEIIVVDSNSADGTAAIAKQLGAAVVCLAEPGVGRARRAGVSAAKGKYVVNIDADTRLPPDYLKKTLQHFETDKTPACLGGQCFFYDAPKWKNFLRAFAYRPLLFFARAVSGGRLGPMGNNMSFRLEDYQKIRGFREDLRWGEDADLTKQLSCLGKIKVDLGLKSYISSRRYKLNKELWKQLLNFLRFCLCGKPYENKLEAAERSEK